MMSIYVELDTKIMNACESYRNGTISSKEIAELFDQYSYLMSSLETKELEKAVCTINDVYENIFWYPYEYDEQPEMTKKIEQDVKIEIMPYVENVEKLIIKGSEDGDPITDEERELWWKKQKEREREEFYKRNGYYEDE